MAGNISLPQEELRATDIADAFSQIGVRFAEFTGAGMIAHEFEGGQRDYGRGMLSPDELRSRISHLSRELGFLSAHQEFGENHV